MADETRSEEIRDRLDKARPGLAEIDGGGDLQKRRATMKGLYTWALYGTYADAILLVNARKDLAWCLDKLDAIRAVLGEEPAPCPEHPDDDPVTCGWKRDNLAIRQILNDTKEN